MKKTSVFQNSLIWFGAGVSIAEILTGTYFAPLGMAKGFAAILLGHLIGCTMMFFAGLIGGNLQAQLWQKRQPVVCCPQRAAAGRLDSHHDL